MDSEMREAIEVAVQSALDRRLGKIERALGGELEAGHVGLIDRVRNLERWRWAILVAAFAGSGAGAVVVQNGWLWL